MNPFVVAAQLTLTNIVSSLVLKSFRANYKLACEWQWDVYFLRMPEIDWNSWYSGIHEPKLQLHL